MSADFGDVPPSILSDEGAKKLMEAALRSGAPIKSSDPGWSAVAVVPSWAQTS